MLTRPTPTGYQHALELRLRRSPADRHTDPLRALADLEDGITQPVVAILEEHDAGAVTVQVSVFSENPEPSPDERAALDGLVAELTFEDA